MEQVEIFLSLAFPDQIQCFIRWVLVGFLGGGRKDGAEQGETKGKEKVSVEGFQLCRIHHEMLSFQWEKTLLFQNETVWSRMPLLFILTFPDHILFIPQIAWILL